MTEHSQDSPDQDAAAASTEVGDSPAKAAKQAKAQYPFPRRTIEDALRVPSAIRTHNGGEPYDPQEVAKVINVGGRTGNFFYLTTASRDYGFTAGARDAAVISLTPLGKQAVYPGSTEESTEARLRAFLNVPKFKGVLEHYKGSKLPDGDFVRNVLETKFGLDPRTHEEFIELFKKNCRYLGIGAEWTPGQQVNPATPASSTSSVTGPGRPVATTVPVLPSPPAAHSRSRPVCFVAMPFTEKTDEYAPGFFTEVYSSLFEPAIEAAGFEARTARGQGSDLIHSTIVNGLLDADLVPADLTEHNPNVLFELGLRIAERRPTVLVKAIGTNPIFDVDNLMRVVSYNPNVWPSTVREDLPRLTEFIRGAWASKETERSYMDILRQQAALAASD